MKELDIRRYLENLEMKSLNNSKIVIARQKIIIPEDKHACRYITRRNNTILLTNKL